MYRTMAHDPTWLRPHLGLYTVKSHAVHPFGDAKQNACASCPF